MIRCEAIGRVLCGGVIDKDLYVSVRTRGDDGRIPSTLLQKTLEGIGGGGGHAHRAGGKVVGIASERPYDRSRWNSSFAIAGWRPAAKIAGEPDG